MEVDSRLELDTFLAFLVLITTGQAFQVIAQPLSALARPADLFARNLRDVHWFIGFSILFE
jgi:hypothetical protein